MQLRSQSNKLGRQSYRHHNQLDHAIHAQHKDAVKRYERTLNYTKKQHWRDWLESADEPDIWMANHYISAPATDRGKARIPVLKYKVGRQEISARTNGEKSDTLAKGFFPPKPAESTDQPSTRYPKQCQGGVKITANQIQKQLCKLKPYKAPGPDGILNIVLTKCADLLIDRLIRIYNAMFE